MSNNNNSNATRSSRASRKRGRAPGNAPAPGSQPAAKRQRPSRQNRKRNAKRGRAQAAKGDVALMGGVSTFFAPVSQGTVIKRTLPQWLSKSALEERIVHREKIAKITTPGTGVFTILRAVALNPGIFASFPWLAQIAAGYEMYRFNRIRFIWVPAVGTAVAGSVIMGPDYDAADAAPVSETALSDYTDSDESAIWIPMDVSLTPDLLNGETRRKFVRTGALAANLDIKTYDSGNFFVASSDDAAANTGKLWIEYDVSLFNPQVPPGGFFQTGTLTSGTTPDATIPFGTGTASLGSPILSAAALVLTVANQVIGQEYSVSMELKGTVITVFTVAATSGVTFKGGDTANTHVNAAGTYALQWFTYTATAETGTITMTVAATTVVATFAVVSVLAPAPAF